MSPSASRRSSPEAEASGYGVTSGAAAPEGGGAPATEALDDWGRGTLRPVKTQTAPRTVAVLFTDLVGSTRLLSRLGETAYDELRRTHFASLRRAVERVGGEEVKGLGDGILAVFGSAIAALDCAVAMQQATDLEARAGAPLALRVGVALGDVTFEEGDVYGSAVVEAARLVAVARAGQILASAVVRAVAGGRCRDFLTELGAIELKGMPEPVAICEVAWEPLPMPTVPLPGLLRGGRIFVGRDEEMRRLERCWDAAAAGSLRGVLVAGEPGVGKTRLAVALAAHVHSAGATVLAGRCDEDLGVPYQPFVEAMRHLVDHTPAEALARRLGRHGGELSRVLPEIGDLLPGLPGPVRGDPETERFRLFDAVAGWLAATSAEQPVLLVLDDLQWAARPTLLLLRHVLRSAEPAARLLVLCTYRDTEVGRAHPLSELLVELRRLDSVDRISLSGLAQPAVVAFLARAAGQELGDERDALARVVHRETEGNPLFVQEVVRHLTETGAIRRLEGRWTTEQPLERLGIPEGVRDVIGRRLSRLSPAANHVLSLGAVAGEEFELPVLQRAGGLEEEALLSALDEAMAARLVAEVVGPQPRYRFSHTLVRATLYDELTGARRVVLHRRVAEAMESVHAGHLDDYLPALAHHYARASAPRSEAVTFAQRAGDRALAQLANDEAVAYYRQALEMIDLIETGPATPRRLALLISLGEAQRRAGDAAHRQTLLDAARLAREQGDAAALARAALANNRGFFSVAGQVDEERLEVLETAVEAVGPGEAGVRARLLANLAGELVFSGDSDRRDRLADEALEIARRHGDLPTLGHVLAHRIPTLVQTRPDTLFACVDELATTAASLHDPLLAFLSAWWGAISALTVADAPDAARRLELAGQLAAELRQPFFQWLSGFVRANLTRITGDLSLAQTQAHQAFEVGRSAGIPDAFRVLGVNLLWIRYDEGRLDEVLELLARATTREHPDPLSVAILAVVLCELRRHPEARQLIDSLAPGGFATLPAASLWLYSHTVAAAACAGVGDRERAAVLYERLRPWGGLVAQCGAGATGTVDHHLGLLAGVLGRHEEAEEHFAAASRLNDRLGAPTWQARTRLEWARVLLVRSRPEDAARARELLLETVVAARELGLRGVGRRADALLGDTTRGV
jgi:class 3 adenylate cyclase/tetratricopeptide (TPR) repeat protein